MKTKNFFCGGQFVHTENTIDGLRPIHMFPKGMTYRESCHLGRGTRHGGCVLGVGHTHCETAQHPTRSQQTGVLRTAGSVLCSAGERRPPHQHTQELHSLFGVTGTATPFVF